MPDLFETIERVEGGSPLVRMRLYGIEVWPVLRVRLVDPAGSATELIRNSVFAALPMLLRGFAGMLMEFVRMLLTRTRRNGCVFFSHVACLAKLDGRWYDRYCDPIADRLEAREIHSTVFDYAPAMDSKTPVARERESVTLALMIVKMISLGVSTIYACFRRHHLKSLAGVLYKENLPSEIDVPTLNRLLAYIWCARVFFEFVLRVYRPRFAFVCTYYNSTSMAFVLACRRRAVTVFDIQHGVQGERHLAYRAWPSAGGRPYAAIPHGFWCWDEASANFLRSWGGFATGTFHAVVGGNVWLEFVLARQRLRNTAEGMGARAGTEVVPCKVVLVTLQPIEEPLGDVLVEAIQRCPDDVRWLIRMHPGMSSVVIEQIAARARAANPAVVCIQTDADESLPVMLAQVDLHVTEYSSVVIEAAACGVTSVVLSDRACELYRSYIDCGLAHWVRSSDELLRFVLAASRPEMQTTPMGSIDRALDQIMGQGEAR